MTTTETSTPASATSHAPSQAPAVEPSPTPSMAAARPPEVAKAPFKDDDADGDKSGGIPRWLKIAAVTIPLVATVCAGIWTVATVLLNQYAAIEKERTDAASLRLEAEKEAHNRVKLQVAAEANARKGALEIQKLQMEEQQARRAVSDNEMSRQATQDRFAQQFQEDKDFGALIEVISADKERSAAVQLAGLTRYVNNLRYKDVLAAALVAKSSRIMSLDEAYLCLSLAAALQPREIDLIVKMNRNARTRVDERGLLEFWRDYITLHEQDPSISPVVFLDMHRTSPAYERIRRDLRDLFPPGTAPTLDAIVRAVEKRKGFVPPDLTVAQANGFLMGQTADVIARYVKSHHSAPDLSGCFLLGDPNLYSNVITDGAFFVDS
jgi:hypothetical protein